MRVSLTYVFMYVCMYVRIYVGMDVCGECVFVFRKLITMHQLRIMGDNVSLLTAANKYSKNNVRTDRLQHLVLYIRISILIRLIRTGATCLASLPIIIFVNPPSSFFFQVLAIANFFWQGSVR